MPSAPANVSYVERLPNELLIMIFDHVGATDAARASQVSRRWYDCAADEHQWRAHYSKYTGRPIESLNLHAPAPSTWRSFYNTLANFHARDRRAKLLSRQASHAEMRASLWPDWRWHAESAGHHFSSGICSALSVMWTPLLAGGAVASSSVGLAVGVGGVTTGMALALATGPLFGSAGVTLGGAVALMGAQGSFVMGCVAMGCAYKGADLLVGGITHAVAKELRAVMEMLSSVVELGEAGYHALYRAPRARAIARQYLQQRDQVLEHMPRLRAELDHHEAALNPTITRCVMR